MKQKKTYKKKQKTPHLKKNIYLKYIWCQLSILIIIHKKKEWLSF